MSTVALLTCGELYQRGSSVGGVWIGWPLIRHARAGTRRHCHGKRALEGIPTRAASAEAGRSRTRRLTLRACPRRGDARRCSARPRAQLSRIARRGDSAPEARQTLTPTSAAARPGTQRARRGSCTSRARAGPRGDPSRALVADCDTAAELALQPLGLRVEPAGRLAGRLTLAAPNKSDGFLLCGSGRPGEARAKGGCTGQAP